jgi:glycosyltransferase involved in cell wall biosynthesis
MSKSRVLIIENSVAITGALKAIVNSCKQLLDQYTFIFVIPSGNSIATYLTTQGFVVYELPMRELSKRIISWVLYLPYLAMNLIRLARLIRKLRIDLIHSNDSYNLLAPAYRMLTSHVPYICHVRFLPNRFPPILQSVWINIHLRFASFIIAVSETVVKQLPASDKIIRIYYGLPVDHGAIYNPLYQRKILYLSNYIQGKGQDKALESFAPIASTYPDWKLIFVGGDMGLVKNREYKKSLQRKAKEYGIERQVEFEDFLMDTEREFINAAFVLNFSESESFSLTCLEAQYWGRPVIATRCGGPEEIIEHQLTGLLVPINDTEEMKHCIQHLIENELTRKTMGMNALTTVRKKFTLENMASETIRLYRNAMKT